MLQQENPRDYVLATGETHSIRDFLDRAFRCIGIDDWSKYVVINPKFYRPAEVDYLRGNPNDAQALLGWKREIDFEELVERMVDSDIENIRKEQGVSL